jgi:queuosine precursor transporter
MKTYRYYDLILGAYVCILLCSNLIGPAKVAALQLPVLGEVTFAAGVLFFPISYIFGDILTEVYGYARDRRCVWAGFGALAFAAIMATTVVSLPPEPSWQHPAPGVDRQQAVAEIFGSTPRIVVASMIAFWCGSFVNSLVLAKMKIATQGRWLWSRIIGSTLCGELVDSALFYTIAFLYVWPVELVVKVTVTQYLLKSGWEIVMTPVTYQVVAFLKRKEQEDYYDRATNFTPFSLRA